MSKDLFQSEMNVKLRLHLCSSCVAVQAYQRATYRHADLQVKLS